MLELKDGYHRVCGERVGSYADVSGLRFMVVGVRGGGLLLIFGLSTRGEGGYVVVDEGVW